MGVLSHRMRIPPDCRLDEELIVQTASVPWTFLLSGRDHTLALILQQEDRAVKQPHAMVRNTAFGK